MKGLSEEFVLQPQSSCRKRKDLGYTMVVRKSNRQDTYQQSVQGINERQRKTVKGQKSQLLSKKIKDKIVSLPQIRYPKN